MAFEAPPVPGYKDVSTEQQAQALVNKYIEAYVLYRCDEFIKGDFSTQQKRYAAIAKTNFQQAFMWLNRALFNPIEQLELTDEELASLERIFRETGQAHFGEG